MLQQPDSSRIRQRDNLDHSAESACVRKWSSRGFAYERAIIDFIRRWHRFAAGQLATSSRNSASASTNSFPRQSNCSDLPAPQALARRPRSGSGRCAGGVYRSARTRRHSSDRLRGCRRVTPLQVFSFVGAGKRRVLTRQHASRDAGLGKVRPEFGESTAADHHRLMHLPTPIY